MARCEVCGDGWGKTFEIVISGHRHVFDTFECAMHGLSPKCARCARRVVGSGIQAAGQVYCGAACARAFEIAQVE